MYVWENGRRTQYSNVIKVSVTKLVINHPKSIIMQEERFWPAALCQEIVIPEPTTGGGRLDPKLLVKNHENTWKLFSCSVFLFMYLTAYFKYLFLYFQKEECTTIILISSKLVEHMSVYSVLKNRLEQKPQISVDQV